MDSIGFGIIGTGNIAKIHSDCINQIEGAILHGVLTNSKERKKEIFEIFKTKIYENIDDFLENSKITIVCICNESGKHGKTIEKVANAKKNILCEKPLEINLKRIEKIEKIVNKNKILLGCVFQNRFNPEYVKLKQIVETGKIGKLLLVNAQVNWYRKPEYYINSWRGTKELDGGAAFINQAIHTIDLVIDLMGEVKNVLGFTDTLVHNIEGEDIGVASIRFKNNALGTISVGTLFCPGFPEKIEIYGTKGNFVFEGGKIVKLELIGQKDQFKFDINEQKSGSSDPIAIGIELHKVVILDMINSVKTKTSPFIDINKSKPSVKLINDIYKFSENYNL